MTCLIFRNNILRKIFFFLLIFPAAGCFAQTGNNVSLESPFLNISPNHIREKVFVHTDRNVYVSGNILWFKLYVVNNATNKLLDLSKVGYVEILNSSNEPVLQGKIALKNGTGSGSFDLPASLESGNYELRAYTNWMKNDSPDYFFRKNITVINTTRNLDLSRINTKPKYEVNFFPEGGNLVDGIRSVVAFKVNDDAGKGVDAKGIITDDGLDTLVQFQSARFGMGQFSFTPVDGKHYTAKITLPDQTILKKELPSAQQSGYVMHVAEEGEKIKVNIQSADVGQPTVYIVVNTNKYISETHKASLQNNLANVLIDKNNIPEGISKITVFNENRQPVCERLFFKRPVDEMKISKQTNKQDFSFRDKINIGITTTGENQKPIPANLSASVYRIDSLPNVDNAGIESYLWLSSELKGFIEDPDFYFSQNDSTTNQALENLLLTQGWRKFNEDDHSKKEVLTYVPENEGHIVLAKVTNEMTGKPANDVLVYLSVPGRRVQLYGCRSNDEGIVHFDLKDFYGPGQVILQTNTTKDSIYRLEILSPFSETYSVNEPPSLRVSEESQSALESRNFDAQIAHVYHGDDLRKLMPMDIDTLPFYYKPYKTYLLDNYTRFVTMEEVLREYVLEVNVLKRQKEFHLNVFNAPGFDLQNAQPSVKIFTTDPLVMLDGVPVFDINKIMAYDPLKVQKLEVVASKYIWGPVVSDGILSFTTYKGNLQDFKLNPHDVIIDYDGLQKQRVFYSPDYSSEKEMSSRLPDFREVLYWAPEINTSTTGKSELSFYSGDLSGKYLVVIQGVSANGKPGSSHFFINVKK